MITLSKSDYLLFRECPHNAWLKSNRPELYYESDLTEFEKAIIETGNEVELCARSLFPDGVLIEGRDASAQGLTQEYIKNGQRVLFQPFFQKDGFLAALDVLEFDKDSGKFNVYEVKATNSIDSKTHYHDLAFQVNLLEDCGLIVDKKYLIHLNSEYVRVSELNLDDLFEIEDASSKIEELQESVKDEMHQALEYVSREEEPSSPCCCIYKGRSKHCSTFRHSNPHVPEYGIHDISRIGSSKNKLKEMVELGVLELDNLPGHIKLSKNQQNQVEAYSLDQPHIDPEAIAKELDDLRYPLYFLDYETFPCAIPRFRGFSPYQQIPFQYSLHIVNSPEEEPAHHEFIFTESSDPSRDFVSSLYQHIGPQGTIIVWNKKFETKINKELGNRLREFAQFVADINSRTYDLMDVFSKQLYVHKGFKGKTSIKVVLPVLAPELSYEDLEIREGGTASQQWNQLTSNIPEEDKQAVANSLREYCKRDTLAMYVIWNHLLMTTMPQDAEKESEAIS